MFCKKCGRWNKDEAMFCMECGETMEQIPTPPPQAEPAAGPVPPVNAQPRYTPGNVRSAPVYSCNNTYVWIMAALPALASLCTLLLVPHSKAISALMAALLIVLNIALSLVDNHQFPRKDIAGWGWLGAVFPTVYLYVRAAKFDHRYAPAVVNTVLLIIDLGIFTVWFFVQVFKYAVTLF